jgi:hypothetical protein
MRESQHLMLTRPCDRRIEQAGDSDSARQPTIDSGLDEAWRQKGKRDRHMDVALAAGLTCGDGVDRRGAGLDLGEPVSCARDRGDELDPGVGADRTGFGLGCAIGDDDVAMAIVLLHGTVRTAGSIVSSSESRSSLASEIAISVRLTSMRRTQVVIISVSSLGASGLICRRTASTMAASTLAAGTRATEPADCSRPWIRAEET